MKKGKHKRIVTKVIDNVLYKRCRECNEFKTLDNYYRNSRYTTGYQHFCKNCSSAYTKSRNTPEKNRESTLRKYNLTPEEYNEMKIAQENKCAICNIELEIFDVDHCHQTQLVRGLLCQNCNKGLGYFNDDLDILFNAMRYLVEFYQRCRG